MSDKQMTRAELDRLAAAVPVILEACEGLEQIGKQFGSETIGGGAILYEMRKIRAALAGTSCEL